MTDSVFEVRRSRPFAVLHALFTLVLLALAVGSVWHFLRAGDGPRDAIYASVFFTVILTVYFFNTLHHCIDRTPLIVVRPEGLHLPTALPDPIPWSQVARVAHPGGLFTGRHRVDIDIAPALRMQAKVGTRIAGDPIVSRRGAPTISVITQNLDCKPATLLAAIKRYWPPADREP
jgi:hypothetical protein